MNPIERLVPRGIPDVAPSNAWRTRDPAELRPVVVLAGGLLMTPRWYRALAALLVECGAVDVLIPPVYVQDWVLASVRGLGPIATRMGRTLLEACARSAASPESLGAPILWIGHSAGGIIGRLLTSPVPFDGRPMRAAGRIGAIVTLGTPHAVDPNAKWGRPISEAGVAFVNRHVPGAFFAPTTGYLAVGSRYVVGEADTFSGRARFVYRLYADLSAPAASGPTAAAPVPAEAAPVAGPSSVPGDGIIPLSAALLPGARHLVVDGAVHGPGTKADWYGRGPTADAWWPVALEVWRDALRARQGVEG